MTEKEFDLDPETVRIMKKVLETPPKPHDKQKVGRSASRKKKAGPKGHAVSAKPQSA